MHASNPLRLLSGIIYSNIFIALCAVLLCFETQVLIGLELQWHPYIFIVFCATFLEYNLHLIYKSFSGDLNLRIPRERWVRDHLKLYYIFNILAVTLLIVVGIQAKIQVIFLLIPIALITLFYSVPGIKLKSLIFRLRDIPYVKIFLIAMVWSAATVIIPVIHTEQTVGTLHILLLFAERFFFILAITIPFDVRDMETDQKAGLKTLPVLVDTKNAYRLAIIFLVIFAITTAFHFHNLKSDQWLFPLEISAITTFGVLLSQKLKTNQFYHYGFLDGTMFLQGLLVILSTFIF